MADKEQEGIVEGKEIPDAETSKDGTQETGTGSGEGATGTKPEPHASDTGEQESKVPTSDAEGGESNDKKKPKERFGWFQGLLRLVKALPSIATVAVAVLTLLTLLEMKTERNNAYRPDIVVSPIVFEGDLPVEDGFEDDKQYMAINYRRIDPIAYFEKKPDHESYVVLERPYLMLKNIGQGTAKDVHVTFQYSWVEEVIEALNRNSRDNYKFRLEPHKFFTIKAADNYYSSDDYKFRLEPYKSSRIKAADIYYFSLEDLVDRYLGSVDEETQNITYISAEEDTVNVMIPYGWCDLLAALYNQEFRIDGPDSDRYSGEGYLNIPSPVITVKCSDMQGKPHTQEIEIPWTGSYKFRKTSDPKDAELEYMHLRTGFYESYIR